MSAAVRGPVLITGGSGQVGSTLMRLFSTKAPDLQVDAPARGALDLLSPESIRACLRAARPQWVVSCGAYTAVDAAETDREAAFAVNATAPGVLAEEAAACGAALIHLSTDYVFDGSGTRPWVETDETRPLSVYGASKLAGEQAIVAVAERTALPYLILRTSWVYSGGGKNFVRTMLRLLSTRTEPVKVVADQHGAPTSADDLSATVLSLIALLEERSFRQGIAGLYHCAAGGETTWFHLAGSIREYLRVQCGGEHLAEILPVSSAEFVTPAARPLNSRLDCQRLASTFGIRLPHWRGSVDRALRELTAKDRTAGQTSAP